MKYNLSNDKEAQAAFTYLTKLVGSESIAEVKKVNPNRSLKQNAYLHLLLGAFGDHFGYTLEEAKTIYKQINKGVYQYEKKGRTFTRSSADLDTKEMTITIDKFREKSKEAGCPLPAATDKEWLMSIENMIEQNNRLRG